MTPERWQRILEVFDAALERDPSRVDDFLRDACGDDEDLLAQVRSLLAAREQSGPLDAPAWKFAGSLAQAVFEVGQTVAGRYRIVRYISHGGMGEVYEAEDLELQERDALKTLLPEIASDAGMIARFKKEIQLSRRISHPNVCKVYDLARHPADGSGADSVFFLTMEFLPGETLAARLERDGRMSAAEALPLVEQMAHALDAAHSAGVIHRDLKPSNVMLVPGSGGPRAVVTDFGLARHQAAESESTATLSGKVMGTLDYMAPELLSGATATFASDIYALGMVVYRMVSGTLPFPLDIPLAAAIRRSQQPIPSPRTTAPELDPNWERTILRALERDPSLRYSSAGHFLRSLRGESSAITVSLPVMSRRRWFAAASVVVLVAGAGVGWRAWVTDRNRPSPEAEALYRDGAADLGAGAYFAATKALGESLRLAPHYAPGHARLAEAWLELELPERAGEEMLLARRQNSDALSTPDRLQIEAVDLTITREFAAAVGRYQALEKLAGSRDSGVEVDLGRAYEKGGKPEEATASYLRAAQAAHNPAAWLRLGVLYGRASNQAKSNQAFDEAERLYQTTSNLEGLTEVAIQRGVAANERGQLAEGARFLQTALDRAKAAENVPQAVRATLQLSTNAYLSGDTDLAEQYARKALESATGQVEALAVRGLITLGNAYFRRRDFAGAEKYYQEGLDVAQRNHSTGLAARASVSLASLHEQLGKVQKGAHEAQQALAFYEPNRFTRESLQCLTLLGRFQERLGDYDGALGFYQRALATAEKTKDPYLTALAHESMGSILFSQEEFPKALPHFQKQLELSSGAEQAGYAALHCGVTLETLGLPSEARAMFDRANAAAEKFASLRLSLMEQRAELALTEGRYAEAEKLARGALEASDQAPDIATGSTRILGLALLGSGRTQEARSASERALTAAAGMGDVGLLLSARLALAQVRLAIGDRSGALELLRQSEPVLANHPESRWRALALESWADDRYRAVARQALDDLGRRWGDHAIKTYLARADIQQLARHLSPAASANHD